MGAIDGNESSSAPSWEEFRASTYREPGPDGLFIVDGDTPIEGLKNLREFYDLVSGPEDRLIVHTAGGQDAAWSATAKLNITYCVSNSFGTNKTKAVTAMAQAAAAWESVANVNYVYLDAQDANCTASNSSVVFDVRPVTGGGYLARAFFPNNSRSSRNVLIDSTAFGSISPWTLKGILTHELGHTLGFRHEHTRPEAGGGCFEDNSWRPLTPYDSASVMHYPQCNGSQNGDLVITSKDQQGAVALYGSPGGNPDPDPDPDPTPGTVTETVSGSVAKNQNAQLGYADVKPGTTFTAVMTGTGDPDLYVRFGSAPTTTQYACRPYLDGASESCTLTVPAGQTKAYVMVRGYTAATYTVTVTYTAP